MKRNILLAILWLIFHCNLQGEDISYLLDYFKDIRKTDSIMVKVKENFANQRRDIQKTISMSPDGKYLSFLTDNKDSVALNIYQLNNWGKYTKYYVRSFKSNTEAYKSGASFHLFADDDFVILNIKTKGSSYLSGENVKLVKYVCPDSTTILPVRDMLDYDSFNDIIAYKEGEYSDVIHYYSTTVKRIEPYSTRLKGDVYFVGFIPKSDEVIVEEYIEGSNSSYLTRNTYSFNYKKNQYTNRINYSQTDALISYYAISSSGRHVFYYPSFGDMVTHQHYGQHLIRYFSNEKFSKIDNIVCDPYPLVYQNFVITPDKKRVDILTPSLNSFNGLVTQAKLSYSNAIQQAIFNENLLTLIIVTDNGIFLAKNPLLLSNKPKAPIPPAPPSLTINQAQELVKSYYRFPSVHWQTMDFSKMDYQYANKLRSKGLLDNDPNNIKLSEEGSKYAVLGSVSSVALWVHDFKKVKNLKFTDSEHAKVDMVTIIKNVTPFGYLDNRNDGDSTRYPDIELTKINGNWTVTDKRWRFLKENDIAFMKGQPDTQIADVPTKKPTKEELDASYKAYRDSSIVAATYYCYHDSITLGNNEIIMVKSGSFLMKVIEVIKNQTINFSNDFTYTFDGNEPYVRIKKAIRDALTLQVYAQVTVFTEIQGKKQPKLLHLIVSFESKSNDKPVWEITSITAQ